MIGTSMVVGWLVPLGCLGVGAVEHFTTDEPAIVMRYTEEHFEINPVSGAESSLGRSAYEACCYGGAVAITGTAATCYLDPTSAVTIVPAERLFVRHHIGYTPHCEYVLAILLSNLAIEPLWPRGELPPGQAVKLSYSEPTSGFLHEIDLVSREPLRVMEYRLWTHSRPQQAASDQSVILPNQRLGRVRVTTWDDAGFPARIERTVERWGPNGSEGLCGRSVYTVQSREVVERGGECPLLSRPPLAAGWTVNDPQRALVYTVGESHLFLGGVEIKVDEPILVGPDELSLEKVLGKP